MSFMTGPMIKIKQTMLQTILLFVCLGFLSACGKKAKTPVKKADPQQVVQVLKVEEVEKDLAAVAKLAGAVNDAEIYLNVDEEGILGEYLISATGEKIAPAKEALEKLGAQVKKVETNYGKPFNVVKDSNNYMKVLNKGQKDQLAALKKAIANINQDLEQDDPDEKPEWAEKGEKVTEKLLKVYNTGLLAEGKAEEKPKKLVPGFAAGTEREPDPNDPKPPVVGGG